MVRPRTRRHRRLHSLLPPPARDGLRLEQHLRAPQELPGGDSSGEVSAFPPRG